MKTTEIQFINFEKYPDKLIPAIIQDYTTQKVLMLGYMNEEAYRLTINHQKVTFYSRSKQCLWTKGEKSGNYLTLKSIMVDCDQDALLVKVDPKGPVCHTGADTCWKEQNTQNYGFLTDLEAIILHRTTASEIQKSYIATLTEKGINKVAQKVGEEAVELIIEAKENNKTLFINEAADLLFHYLILLQLKKTTLQDIVDVLNRRNKK